MDGPEHLGYCPLHNRSQREPDRTGVTSRRFRHIPVVTLQYVQWEQNGLWSQARTPFLVADEDQSLYDCLQSPLCGLETAKGDIRRAQHTRARDFEMDGPEHLGYCPLHNRSQREPDRTGVTSRRFRHIPVVTLQYVQWEQNGKKLSSP